MRHRYNMPGKMPLGLFRGRLLGRLQLVRGGPFVSLGPGLQVVAPLQGCKPEEANDHDGDEDNGCGSECQ